MFCYQCEQTDRTGAVPGCSTKGSCGKDEVTAALQDLLIHLCKGIGQYETRARALGAADPEAAGFLAYALFSTLTNVNFTATRFVRLIQDAVAVRDRVRAGYEAAARAAGEEPRCLAGPAVLVPAPDIDAMVAQAADVGVLAGRPEVGEDVVGLRAFVLYAVKGVCAYVHHARVLGHHSDEVDLGVAEALSHLADEPTDAEEILARILEVGRVNLEVMALLDTANTSTFGTPAPTKVKVTPVAGKAILVSGHGFDELEQLLRQTEGTGINVYTHGEMLPAHSYPELAKYPHLAGNIGGAWQDQQQDFANFPGPIVMTSNCLIEPLPAYRVRTFTTGPVGWPGVRHLTGHDYAAVIRAAKAGRGYPGTEEPAKEITIGFGRQALLSISDTVIDAVHSGDIRHMFLIGGCDGAAPGRDYYTELARATPEESVILTLGCNKYRFNKLTHGTTPGGLPRLLDVGQCNDTYAAIRVAQTLATALDTDVNSLPLTIVLAWFEQKALAILATVLHLGLRNVLAGPTLPAFVTEPVWNLLCERFGLRASRTAEEDLADALAGAR
ncbi:hydroxylamine reductase [Streptomyces sp. NPDC059917]|uniref:hydroxylamine reductase n=1 Tax=Streptomyces sp. NPDC059917 TaxID=3347002 RepID=UPI00364F48C1